MVEKKLDTELETIDPTPLPQNEESVKEDNTDNKHTHHRPAGQFWSILRSVQRYSSYGFTAFATMHVASVIVTPAFSLEAGNSTLNFSKAVYQEWYLEPVLVYAPLTLHIASGAILRFHANYLHRKHYLKWPTLKRVWSKMSGVSKTGVIITPMILLHLYTMRIAPLNVLGDSASINLEYVAHWFHNSPIFMWSVYPLMVFGTIFHMTMGWKKWLELYGRKYTRLFFGITGSFTVLGVVSLVRMARMPQATGWIAKQFNQVLALF